MAVIVWADWYSITFVVISATMALVALAYMVGIGFHLPKLQAWAKEEFYQALASALIAVLFISFVSTIKTTMQNLYGGDPFQIASTYIGKVISSLTVLFMAVVGTDVPFSLMQSLTFKAMPSQMGFSINPFIGLTTLTSMLSLMMEGILGAMAVMLSQGTFLLFIQYQLPIIFPIGIALRAFPWTRHAGGALIAIFFGFYIFYPFLWVFNSAIYDETIQQLSFMGAARNFVNALGIGAGCIENPTTCLTNVPDFGANIMLALINLIAYPVIAHLFIFAILLPLFNLLTVLILINELAKIFGSEIDLGGLQGLI